MAINMMCTNSKCKSYWEDNCTRNINEERIEINGNGQCETFEAGISQWYEEESKEVSAEHKDFILNRFSKVE
jgi:hypothetical protein